MYRLQDNLKRLVPNAAQLKAKDLSSSDKTASQSGIPPVRAFGPLSVSL
jgi:hypothetical protein